METKCVTESPLAPQPRDTSGQIELIQRAKAISKEERKKILVSFKETELHGYLKELFQRRERRGGRWFKYNLTHSAASRLIFKDGVRKGSLGSTLNPRPERLD